VASAAADPALRRVVRLVAALNLAYFGIEFAIARVIGSVSLFADSIDFLEDASVNFLILVALGWTVRNRARLGMLLAGILLAPGLATLWTAWEKFNVPAPPEPVALSLAGLGALAVNLFCATMLARYRHHSGSLTRAAFLSARNDALANVAIIAAGLITAFVWPTAWPDLIVGFGIAVMNADAAREVWGAAREEHRAVEVA
jgi:Co/Zn/Cd efflux system component